MGASSPTRLTIYPPYGIIANRMLAGKIVPFLGAGASLVGLEPGKNWDAKAPTYPPSGGDLSRHLADETTFPLEDFRDRSDLSKVSSYYVDNSSRTILKETLRAVLARHYQFGNLHKVLAAQTAIRLFVVTNYDTLLEDAFDAIHRPYDLVIYPADRKDLMNGLLWRRNGEADPITKEANEFDVDFKETSVIFKMHGTVGQIDSRNNNFVITEEDYVEFLSRMTTNSAIPPVFLDYARDCSFLFLGYSLSDWNFRVLLRNLGKHLITKAARAQGSSKQNEQPSTPIQPEDDVPSWAIQLNPSELERILWNKRNVKIFDLSVEEFAVKMLSRLGG
jgi:hypothetical protein